MELLTLAGALAVGSLAFWGFWVVALVGVCVLVALTENEHYGWATGLFAVFFGALAWLGIFNLYNFTLYHPGQLLARVGIYLGIGIVWGAIKWWRYCVKERNRYEEAKSDFLKANNAQELTPGLRVLWTKKLKDASRFDRHYVLHAEAPDAKNHKEKICNWMYLWPFSMLGTILSDFVRKIWDAIYDWMGGVYDTIARSVWKGTENDLASEQDLAAAKSIKDTEEAAIQQVRRAGRGSSGY